MQTTLCPNCNRPNALVEIGDGMVKCKICGFTGYQDGRNLLKK